LTWPFCQGSGKAAKAALSAIGKPPRSLRSEHRDVSAELRSCAGGRRCGLGAASSRLHGSTSAIWPHQLEAVERRPSGARRAGHGPPVAVTSWQARAPIAAQRLEAVTP